MVMEYIQTQSYQRVQLDFAVRFFDRNPALKSVIHYYYKKFQENWTIMSRNRLILGEE